MFSIDRGSSTHSSSKNVWNENSGGCFVFFKKKSKKVLPLPAMNKKTWIFGSIYHLTSLRKAPGEKVAHCHSLFTLVGSHRKCEKLEEKRVQKESYLIKISDSVSWDNQSKDCLQENGRDLICKMIAFN